VAKTHGGSTSFKSPALKPPTIGSPQPLSGKKEADDKEVPVDPSSPDKKLGINTGLEDK
jgi:hypothetical protein